MCHVTHYHMTDISTSAIMEIPNIEQLWLFLKFLNNLFW